MVYWLIYKAFWGIPWFLGKTWKIGHFPKLNSILRMRIAKSFFGMAKQSINLADFTEPDLLENIPVKESLLKAIPPKGTAYYTSEAELLFLTETIGGAPQSYDPTEEMDEQADMSRSGKHALLDAFDRFYGLDEEEIEPDEAVEETSAARNYYENYTGPTCSVDHAEDEISFLANPAASIEATVEKILPPKLEEKFDASITKEIEVRKENKLCGRAELSQRHLRKKKGLSYYRYGAVQ